MKEKLVVYTALFGNYDDLIDPIKDFEGCDFICFTDQKNLKSDIWNIHIVNNINLPSNMMNRKYKMLPHIYLSAYKKSLYIDANIKVLSNPFELADMYLNESNFVVPKHFIRDCIYDEALECISLGKSEYNETIQQIHHYIEQGFPKKYGLGENNILLRNHNDANLISIMNSWWYEVNNRTKRDQLSLAYVMWKNGEQFSFMDESARGSKYFRIKPHSNQLRKGAIGYLLNLKNEHITNFPNGKVSKISKLIRK